MAGPVSRFNNEKDSLPKISIFSPEPPLTWGKADWLNGRKVRGDRNSSIVQKNSATILDREDNCTENVGGKVHARKEMGMCRMSKGEKRK